MSAIVGGLAAYQSGKTQEKIYDANASVIERQSKDNLRIASQELADIATQGERAASTARTQQAASGFTTEGSGNTREQRIMSALGDQLSTASQSYAQQDINAKHDAAMQRWQGDLAAEQGKAALASGIFSSILTVGIGAATGGTQGALKGM